MGWYIVITVFRRARRVWPQLVLYGALTALIAIVATAQSAIERQLTGIFQDSIETTVNIDRATNILLVTIVIACATIVLMLELRVTRAKFSERRTLQVLSAGPFAFFVVVVGERLASALIGAAIGYPLLFLMVYFGALTDIWDESTRNFVSGLLIATFVMAGSACIGVLLDTPRILRTPGKYGVQR